MNIMLSNLYLAEFHYSMHIGETGITNVKVNRLVVADSGSEAIEKCKKVAHNILPKEYHFDTVNISKTID